MKIKSGKLKKYLQGVALLACLSPWMASSAAQEEFLWGNVSEYSALLKKFSLTQKISAPKNLQLPKTMNAQKNTVNSFQFLAGALDATGTSHVRYAQYYKDLPVWGTQVIYHLDKTSTTISGSPVTGLEVDVPNTQAKISFDQAKKIAFGANPLTEKMAIQKVIFFDKNISTKALLAYHVTYLKQDSSGPSIPSFIIDANSGKILKEWDSLASVGQGPGGTAGAGEYKFDYDMSGGNIPEGVKAFGGFDAQYGMGGVCTVSNKSYRIINLQNKAPSELPFTLPVSLSDEVKYSLAGFKYLCWYPEYLNNTDNGFSPVNSGLSPINDAAYFVKNGIAMLGDHYKAENPISLFLPLRVYTHIANYEKSYACGVVCTGNLGQMGGVQMGLGNGGDKTYPLTSADVIAHELGHLVTEYWSKLERTDQSGAINEAFSDMTAMAFNYYLRNTLGFTWYWDENDWGIGTRVNKSGNPSRRMDTPTIAHMNDYKPGMDLYLASGIYSKAFYLLSKTNGWTVEKAYEVFLLANLYAWTSNTDFNTGVCGVQAAAKSKNYAVADVTAAFQQVGAVCPSKPKV